MKTIRRVFLAGKITGNDWRRELLREDCALKDGVDYDYCPLEQHSSGRGLAYPIRERAVLSLLDYVGPYYVACPAWTGNPHEGSPRTTCGHGGDLEHGYHGEWGPRFARHLMHLNKRAIEQADVVFAWLDDLSAYATLYELGYASALGKEVWIAGPRYFHDLELVYRAAAINPSPFNCQAMDSTASLHSSPGAAFVAILSQRLADAGVGANADEALSVDPAALSSPIEEQFLRAWNAANPVQGQADGPRYYGLFPQYPVDGGRYRLDFAVLGTTLAIELDGLQAHQSTEQIAYDRKRQREIEGLGWRVIRFGGKEVYQSPEQCVAEVRVLVDRQDAEHGRRVVAEAREWLAQYQQWRLSTQADVAGRP